MLTRLRHILPVSLALLLSGAALAYSDAGDTVTLRDQVDDDYYAAGGIVDIDAEVDGDVIVAGGEVMIGHRVAGDVIAAGGTLRLHGEIDDDVRVSGGELDIDARIGDDLVAAGGSIRLSALTRVGGNAWLAGGDVHIEGTIVGNLRVAGGSIVLAGTVRGDVELEGGEIEILERAVIDGDLRYSSPRPATTAGGAAIGGQVSHEALDRGYADRGYGLFFTLTFAVAGIVFYLLFPRYTVGSLRRIATDPWPSLGLGFIFVVAAPVVALLLLLILLGFWVGLILLALYAVALLLGFLIGCFFLGDRGAALFRQELSSTGRRLISVVVVIFILGLIRLVPLLGGLTLFLLMLFGLGAGLLQIAAAYRLPAQAE